MDTCIGLVYGYVHILIDTKTRVFRNTLVYALKIW